MLLSLWAWSTVTTIRQLTSGLTRYLEESDSGIYITVLALHLHVGNKELTIKLLLLHPDPLSGSYIVYWQSDNLKRALLRVILICQS